MKINENNFSVIFMWKIVTSDTNSTSVSKLLVKNILSKKYKHFSMENYSLTKLETASSITY